METFKYTLKLNEFATILKPELKKVNGMSIIVGYDKEDGNFLYLTLKGKEKRIKILYDSEYTYNIQKQGIFSVHNAKELYDKLAKINDDEFWNNRYFDMLVNAWSLCRDIR